MASSSVRTINRYKIDLETKFIIQTNIYFICQYHFTNNINISKCYANLIAKAHQS